jgi:hypothetical protein
MFGDLFEDRKDEEEIDFPPNGTSLDLLQAIYRSPTMPLHTRMRAAMSCLKHEHPALGITAQVTDMDDLAKLLDQRIKRYEMKMIQHQPSPAPVEPPPAPTKAPLAHTIDRRYRRI